MIIVVALAAAATAAALLVVRAIALRLRHHRPLTRQQRAQIRRFRAELRRDDLVNVLHREKGRWMS